jgi:two-component system phosphate regulon response regulator OmpR
VPEPWTTRRPRVLVVADDQDGGELLTRLLDRAGWTADLAYSAASGLSELDGAEYSALVVDLVDPGAGVEVLRTVRDDPGTADLPVVLCSRHGSYRSEAWISGADAFLVHPFEADAFVVDVSDAVARPSDAREEHRQTQLGLSIPDAPA